MPASGPRMTEGIVEVKSVTRGNAETEEGPHLLTRTYCGHVAQQTAGGDVIHYEDDLL